MTVVQLEKNVLSLQGVDKWMDEERGKKGKMEDGSEVLGAKCWSWMEG